MRNSSAIVFLASAILFAACNNAGDVLTTQRPNDAGEPAADAAALEDADINEDAAELADAGAGDQGTPDVPFPPPPPSPVERVPGLYGAWFHVAGKSGAAAYLLGRRLDESEPHVYRLHSDHGGHDRLPHPTDDRGAPLFPPIGPIVELDARILWATESGGIVASENSGQNWAPLTIPWEDGSVGNGNGHVSRILESWKTGDSFCVHREVTPWVNFQVQDENRYNEVRCLTQDTWSTVTTSIAEGMRFFNAYGDDLYGNTAPLYNQETGAPKFCHSANLGIDWDCFPFALSGFEFYRTDSGRLVMPEYVDTSSATHTQIWYSDDHGEHWDLALTVETPLTNFGVIGEKIYAATLILDVASEVHELELDQRTDTLLPIPTGAHLQWMELFDFLGDLHIADSRGLRRYDRATQRWLEVEVEPLPALRVGSDPSGNIWTIDGTRTARRLPDEGSAWDEIFFDDTGWGAGDVVDHAISYDFTRIGSKLFFGTAHRKLFIVETAAPAPMVSEDLTLTGIIDPDSALHLLANAGDQLFVAATGGEYVNHGNGNRTPYGGGVFRRDPAGNWSDVSMTLPTRLVGNSLGRGIAGALYADTGVLIAATHAGVYRSVNQGASWSAVRGLVEYDANEIITYITGHGSNILLAVREGSTQRFYRSANNGEEFEAVETNLDAGGTVRALKTDEAGRYYVLLDPFGLLISLDGSQWEYGSFRQTLDTLPDRTFSLNVEPDQILVGTTDGVWRIRR